MKTNKTNRDSKTKKKHIIDTYTTMYFVDIVVANQYTTLEELKKLYSYSDKVELDDLVLNGDCTTTFCLRKSDNKPVCLVKYNGPSDIKGLDPILDLINTVCHEAGHCVMDIYRSIGQDICPCSQEPVCYFLGYVAECIYKTLTKK